MTKSIGIENFSLCHECGGYTDFSNFRGEETCSQCGLVKNERMFKTSDRGKKKSEHILPPYFRFYDPYQFHIHKRDRQICGNYQKNFSFATQELSRIWANLRLPLITK